MTSKRFREDSQMNSPDIHPMNDHVSVIIHCSQDDSYLLFEDPGGRGFWLAADEPAPHETWEHAAMRGVEKYFPRSVEVTRIVRLHRMWSARSGRFIHHVIFALDIPAEIKSAIMLTDGARWMTLEELVDLNASEPTIRTSKALEVIRSYQELVHTPAQPGIPYLSRVLVEVGPSGAEERQNGASRSPPALGRVEEMQYEIGTHSIRLRGSDGAVTDVSTLANLEDEGALTKSAKKSGEAGLESIKPRGAFSADTLPNRVLKLLKYFVKKDVTKPALSWGEIDMERLGKAIILLSKKAKDLFNEEPRLVKVESPVYIFGDIHGSYRDIRCYEKTIWRLGAALLPASLLFLGDYVDRGTYGAEVVCHLFSQKLLAPKKVFLVRGNHEVRKTQRRYGFYNECLKKFGEVLGEQVWNSVNDVFDVLPIAAVVDSKVYCAHGGIPPPNVGYHLSDFEQIPKPLSNPREQSQLAWEVLWCDPAEGVPRDVLEDMKENSGFAPNEKRGTAHLFSTVAVEDFLKRNNLSHIVRAHEPKQPGFQVQQAAKVLTVFSSSDYGGRENEAACVLAEHGKLRLIRFDTS